MTSQRWAVCEWCGESFAASERGRLPKFCKRSHRQRAYEARTARQGESSQALESRRGLSFDDAQPVPDAPNDRDSRLEQLAVTLADSDIDSGDANRPTVLLTILQSLLDALDAVLVAVRYHPGDLDAVRRFVIAGSIIESLRRQRTVSVEHPRSARKLAHALAETKHLGRSLLDPASAGGPASHRSRTLRLAIPGPDGLLAPGLIDVALNTKAHREARWHPDDETPHAGAQLHRVARRSSDPHRFGDSNDWEHLARDMIIVCCGWITSTLPVPRVLDTSAARALGQQLHSQFRSGEWSIRSNDVIDWLIDTGYVTVTADTAVSNPALAAVHAAT